VQAKRLYPNESYKQLQHRVRGQLQSGILINSSGQASDTFGTPTLPIYAFYNCLEGRREEPWLCCGLKRYQPLLGVTVAPATLVARLASNGQTRYTEILPISKPLSCLVHCPAGRTNSDTAGSHAQALLHGIQQLHDNDVSFGVGLALPRRILASLQTGEDVDGEPGDPSIGLVTSHQPLEELADAESDTDRGNRRRFEG
jgi:hypothetical protein